jgi:D-serine deaminase-like pyridoxal phosphate-dependent protein
VIDLGEPGAVELGQKIRLIPGHCDPTVNLYDWLVGYRGERVEEIWPISARGAFY